MSNVLADKLIESLEPLLGSVVATAALQTQAAKIGKTIDTIDSNDLEKLAKILGSAMSGFGKNVTAITEAIMSVR